jgi:hypothetical protein
LADGISGQVLALKRPMIFSDVQKSSFYHPKVDLYSLLPIYFIPILTDYDEEKSVIGILEIVLKSKSMKERIDEKTYASKMAEKFCIFTDLGLKFLMKNISF